MYKIRTYTKSDGTTGYELFVVATTEVVARDNSYAALRQIKKGMERKVSA